MLFGRGVAVAASQHRVRYYDTTEYMRRLAAHEATVFTRYEAYPGLLAGPFIGVGCTRFLPTGGAAGGSNA